MASQHLRDPSSAMNIDTTTIRPPAMATAESRSPPTAAASPAAKTGSSVITTAACVALNPDCAHACTANPTHVATTARYSTEHQADGVGGTPGPRPNLPRPPAP